MTCDKCQFKLWRVVANKALTENQIKTLLDKSISDEIKGFKSKAGKTFSAKLVLVDKITGKLEFKFN